MSTPLSSIFVRNLSRTRLPSAVLRLKSPARVPDNPKIASPCNLVVIENGVGVAAFGGSGALGGSTGAVGVVTGGVGCVGAGGVGGDGGGGGV